MEFYDDNTQNKETGTVWHELKTELKELNS